MATDFDVTFQVPNDQFDVNFNNDGYGVSFTQDGFVVSFEQDGFNVEFNGDPAVTTGDTFDVTLTDTTDFTTTLASDSFDVGFESPESINVSFTNDNFRVQLSGIGVQGPPGSGGGGGSDVRPLIEQARSRVTIGFVSGPKTRDSNGLLSSEVLTLPDGTTVTHTVERDSSGLSTREYWQGSYISGLIRDASSVSGNAFIHTITRDSNGLSTDELWSFGFLMAVINSLFYTDNGDVISFDDQVALTDNGDIINYSDNSFVTDNGDIVRF